MNILVELTQASWGKAKSKRKEKYAFWLNRGYSPKQAYQARDWGFKKAKAAVFVGPQKPPQAPNKFKAFNLQQRKDLWKTFSEGWRNSGRPRETEILSSLAPWQKKLYNKWAKEATDFNRGYYNNIWTDRERRVVSWDEAKDYSAGPAACYFHYIEKNSWQKARERVQFPDPFPSYDPDAVEDIDTFDGDEY